MTGSFATFVRSSLSRLSRRTPSFRGKVRLLRNADQILRKIRDETVVMEVGGANYQLDTGDLIDFRMMYQGGTQSELVGYITARLRAAQGPQVFWDVGANVGSFSIPITTACPGLHVQAFEPSPPVNARLRRNIALNPALAGRVTVHDVALSEQTGESDFFVSNERENSGVGGLAEAHNREGVAVRVRTVRGDDLVKDQGVPPPTVMKVDVEGFEYAVFQGMSSVLDDPGLREIIFEHSRYRFDDSSAGLETCVDFFTKRRWDLLVFVASGGGEVRPLKPEDLERSCDIVARRAD